ncbi:hypothetical protein E2562_026936 [Oryza meyeriana var. granulata]|uniref:Uncharacterized protein n=1 Tax=Oryza meyeriana var. granulata TaxID=110450 RepID=A0A6G1EZ75_9ORYZ|nr:hypothetical protein E2562_026936 [Oryza meyeriana var. granulata]
MRPCPARCPRLAASHTGKDTCWVTPPASRQALLRTLDRRKLWPPWPPMNCHHRSDQWGKDP